MPITSTLIALAVASCAAAEGTAAEGTTPIDRCALVQRHNLTLTTPGRVQVGNGEFAFSADLTGLQSTEECCTMSHWAWHTSPLPAGERVEDFKLTPKQVYGGRTVDFITGTGDAISQWLYANPHRMNLGRIRLIRLASDAAPIQSADIVNPRQTLDLWNGLLDSQFELDGQPVHVVTACHPRKNAVAIRVESPLLAAKRLAVEFAFSYPDLKEFGGYGDWSKRDGHTTSIRRQEPGRVDLMRQVDSDTYNVAIAFATGALFTAAATPHCFTLALDAPADAIEFTCAYAPGTIEALPSVAETIAAARTSWNAFWQAGGALDLHASTDPRANELERRIVLSEYITAVNCAGSLPPQESGLVNNGWNGKFHFEMYWWHGAQFALWNRWDLLQRSLGIYRRLLPAAREKAARQGYRGARWPKCTGPEGRESPHPIHAMLIWQQPHPIFFAELDYRAHPSRATLDAWRDIVFDTADFMASFAVYEERAHRYVLGPPIYTVPETTDPERVYNPAFELAYWRFALSAAQTWRERLGLSRDPAWQQVLDGLAPLYTQEGVYLLEEHLPDSYSTWNYNHPSVAGIYGILPGAGVDIDILRRTFHKVLDCWKWSDTWGWDFPMLAMSAARLGEQERAIDLLLHPNFGFDDRGYPVGGGPWPYLPSSGGLLYAAAMMAAGWDGAPAANAPGFPATGNWIVRSEGLAKAP